MMNGRGCLILIACSGLAAHAGAQSFSLTLVASASTITAGDSFTVEVYGDADVGTHIFGGVFGLASDSPLVSAMTWTPAAWSIINQDGGYAGKGNYNSVLFGQVILPGVPPFDQPAIGSELEGRVGQFVIEIRSGVEGVIDLMPLLGAGEGLEVYDVGTGRSFRSIDGDISLRGAEVRVSIPAPTGAALLALACAIPTRRKPR